MLNLPKKIANSAIDIYIAQITIVRKCFRLISREEIFKIKLVALAQLMLSFIDLLSVAALGLVGSLTVYGIQSKGAEGNALTILHFLKLDSLSFQKQVAIIGGVAALMLVFRTIISSVIQLKTVRFLSLRSAAITTRLI